LYVERLERSCLCLLSGEPTLLENLTGGSPNVRFHDLAGDVM
jgi:hypothetical protein